MNFKLTNIPAGIIKKSNKPDKLVVTYKYTDAKENFSGYACSTFDKSAFSPVNPDKTLYNLNIDENKKVCMSFKNQAGRWRNKWVTPEDFCTEFNKTRAPKQQMSVRERSLLDSPFIDGDDEYLTDTDLAF